MSGASQKRGVPQQSVACGAPREKSLRALREAIERIVQLTPKSSKLMATLKRRKKLRLSVAAVAAEAGITRVGLYKVYPEIVAEIRDRTVRKPAPVLTTAEETALKMREENSLLRQSNKDLLSENAGLLFRLSTAEDRIKRLTERLSRIEGRERGSGRRPA